MIPCSNRYRPLENAEGSCNTTIHKPSRTCMPVGDNINPPQDLDKPLRLHDSPDLASVHRKLDEVKNLVPLLMNQLMMAPGSLCGCSCSRPKLDVPCSDMRDTPITLTASESRPQADDQYLQPGPISHIEGSRAPSEATKHKCMIDAEDQACTRPNRSDKTIIADYSETIGFQAPSGATF
ncbi:hypothetical protein NDU88_005208 [Pleurodeles waltl]|uniref:Uncharacterized protein n=1 Tax=Pleurodeles waltl TaxID=8319 RepID=A0AAV7PHG5_PLEWA|nr:hypothetical protein NDU88_005208 [Pleurodeles waltl]